jgi:hypothetical protein
MIRTGGRDDDSARGPGDARPTSKTPALVAVGRCCAADPGVDRCGHRWPDLRHTYAPLWSGGGSTASLTPKTLKIETAAGQQIQYVLVGPPGTVGTSYFTLTNNGRYPVTVQGAFSHDPYTDATLSWAPESPFTEAISGPSRPFPTTIRHNQAIAIETSETQPNCKNGVDGRTTYAASISWSALGVHHVFDVPSGLGQEVMPIMTCPRASMLGFLATN